MKYIPDPPAANIYDQVIDELNDKRETLSQVLEKNGKLDLQIVNLEQQLNETKQNLIHSESIINELNHIKTETVEKAEENIQLKLWTKERIGHK